MKKKILVTGGCGYIGSHIVLKLLESGYEAIVLDNLSNSSNIPLKRIEKICGKKPKFIHGDITDAVLLDKIFSNEIFDAVIHCAGLKSVSESLRKPISYFQNNVFGSLQLISAMSKHGVKKIIFSSSATIYGASKEMPLKESSKMETPTNPYGLSKKMIEEILSSIFFTEDDWSVINLRYFNPVGAHQSGLLGEDPIKAENLMPIVSKTAIGHIPKVTIYGDDYDTHDGTGVRDYIHVVDLAEAHLMSLKKIFHQKQLLNINLGTGRGYSVLDIINEFEKVSGVKIPYSFTARREGDLAEVYADPSLAKTLIGWQAKYGLKEMCKATWKWQKNNPNGYQ